MDDRFGTAIGCGNIRAVLALATFVSTSGTDVIGDAPETSTCGTGLGKREMEDVVSPDVPMPMSPDVDVQAETVRAARSEARTVIRMMTRYAKHHRPYKMPEP